MLIKDPKKWSRRRVLAGLGAGAALMPFVPLLPSLAEAQTAEKIKRYVQWFYPLGTNPGAYFPSGGETDWQISNVLEPLKNLRDSLIVFSGMDQTKAVAEPHDAACVFTGSVPENDLVGYGPGHGDQNIVGQGTSLDQYLAGRWGKDKPYSIIQLDICNNGGPAGGAGATWHSNSRLDYKGIPGERDPYAAFDRLFAGIAPSMPGQMGPDPKAERIRAQKQSVIDQVLRELTVLQTTSISQADKDMLEAHLEGIRGIERRLQSGGAVAANCGAPAVDKSQKLGALDYTKLLELGKLQMDIAFSAISCDLTRVINFQWMRNGTDESIPMLDIGNYHGLTHGSPGDPGMMEKIRQASLLFHEQLAYFAQRLKDTQEGETNMLDHTIILTGSDVSEPNSHTEKNHPYLIVGGSNVFRTGRHLQFGKIFSNRLFVSICQAVGMTEVQLYGDMDKSSDHPAFKGDRGSGPIAEMF
jgi:hypothetical protein